MDPAAISGIIAAVFAGLFGMAKLGAKLSSGPPRPPEPSGAFAAADIGTAARLDRIEAAMQEQAIERAREAVHAAEARRLIADVASAVHALAMAVEHMRRDADRNHNETMRAHTRGDRRT